MTDIPIQHGGCHCGAVRFDVKVDLAAKIIACNCSLCSKTGALMAFVPAAAFTLRTGDDVLTDYQFHKKRIHHLFCRTCGIRPFSRGTRSDGGGMLMIDLRCLDGVDVDTLVITKFDGKSR